MNGGMQVVCSMMSIVCGIHALFFFGLPLLFGTVRVSLTRGVYKHLIPNHPNMGHCM